MKRTKLRLTLSALLIVFILAFIWGNSLMPGEDSGSFSGLVGQILSTLLPFLDFESESSMHILRKIAHFSEFAALGWSFAWLFGMTVKGKYLPLLLPLLCGITAACVDEFIQLFSPGRYCSIVDVGIDSAGVVTGIIVLNLLHLLCNRIFNRTKK